MAQKYGEEHRKTAVDVVDEDSLPTWQVTLTYLDFLRLRRANERYLQLLENTRYAFLFNQPAGCEAITSLD